MKIYVTHSTGFDFKKELYSPIRSSSLNSLHEIILPHEKSDEPFNSKNFIPTCDLIIAEVSHPSTGQGIELGWASVSDVPIVAIYKEGSKISDSIKTITGNMVAYKDLQDMIERLEETLNNI